MITIDRNKGTCRVELHYGVKRYFVTFVANPKKHEFTPIRVQSGNGRKPNDSGIRAQLEVAAERELYAFIERQWKPLKKSFCVADRLEIAYAFKFAKWMRNCEFVSMEDQDIGILHSCASAIKDVMTDRKIEARKTHQPLGNYLDNAKKDALVMVRKRHIMTNRKRDFLDAVLGQGFSWNAKTVPLEAIETAKLLLPKTAMIRVHI